MEYTQLLYTNSFDNQKTKNMSDKKQTAVQWFKDVAYPYLDKESKEYVDILFNHALQMEREQIIEAANNGCKGMCMIDTSRDGKQYYNDTYGGQDEN